MKRSGDQFVGASVAMVALQEEIDCVAQSDAKVLVLGESGVGKELVARAVHTRSQRAIKPFVAVNCAGIPETLLESELFGHVRGSFTGAYRDKAGKLEAAHGGTVFLDEIGEMTLRMQGLLLRFLETGEVQKVGADETTHRLDVRVIAATNRDLRALIAQGQFREDLYYRLNVINIVVPSLRERRSDIQMLLEHFLTRFAGATGRSVRTLAPESLRLLVDYNWPGNVRELENVVERMVVTGRSETVLPADLPMEVRGHNGHNGNGRPRVERRRTVADELYKRLVDGRESFWTVVYPLYMQREITRTCVRELVQKGLQESRGNYKIVARIFNMEQRDYKRFLNFLRKHDCQLPFKEYRRWS